jgi:hypothetical protein
METNSISTKRPTLLIISLIVAAMVLIVIVGGALVWSARNSNNAIFNPISDPVSSVTKPILDTVQTTSYHVASGKIISVSAGSEIKEVLSSAKPIGDIATAPDSQTIVYATQENFDGAPMLVELREYSLIEQKDLLLIKSPGALKRVFPYEPSGVSYIANSFGAFAFHPVANKIVYSIDRSVYLFDLTTQESQLLDQLEAGNFTKLTWDASGNYLLADRYFHESYGQNLYKFADGKLTKLAIELENGCCGSDAFQKLDFVGADLIVFGLKASGDNYVFQLSKFDPASLATTEIFASKPYSLMGDPVYGYGRGYLVEAIGRKVIAYQVMNGKLQQVAEQQTTLKPDLRVIKVAPPFVIIGEKASNSLLWQLSGTELIQIATGTLISQLSPETDGYLRTQFSLTADPDLILLKSEETGDWAYRISTNKLARLDQLVNSK